MGMLSHLSAPIAGALALSGAWAVGDLVIPDVISGYAVMDGPVSAGSTSIVEWHIYKNTDCPGYSARVWDGVNGYSLSEPVQPTSLPSGAGVYRIPTRFPETIPAGRASLSIRGHFDCPGAPERYFVLGPVSFEVAGASGASGNRHKGD